MPPVNPNDVVRNPQTLGTMPALPNMTNPYRDTSNAHTQQETVDARDLHPAKVREANANAARAELALRAEREKQGLDPITGKPNPNSGKVGQDAISDLSPAEQAEVKAIVNGRLPITPYSLAKSPDLNRLYQRAIQYDPGTDLTTFQRRAVAYQKFMSDPKSPVVRLNQALAHLKTFYDAASALGNTNSNVPGVSYVKNLANEADIRSKQSGKATAFDIGKQNLATELAALFKGDNNPAITAIKEQQDNITAHSSQQQIDAFARTVAEYIQGRAAAQDYAFKQAVGPDTDAHSLLNPIAQKAYDEFTDPNFGQTPEGQKQLSTTSQTDSVPPGYAEAHANFLRANPPGNLTPEAYMAERQKLDQQFGQHSVIDPESAKQFTDQYNAISKTPLINAFDPGSLPIPMAEKPLTKLGSEAAKASESAPGAFLESAANAGTGGLVDLAAGQEGRELSNMNNENHWIASDLGDVAGSIAPINASEKLLGGGLAKIAPKLSPKALAMLSEIGGNAAYGAARGFNGANDGEGAEDALGGALGGTAGALVGRFMTKGMTGFLPKSTEDALQQLNGVKLTTLQRLGAGKLENGFSAVPGIHGAQEDALWSFNKQRAQNLLDDAGITQLRTPNGTMTLKQPIQIPDTVKTPQDLNEFLHETGNQAYEAVKPQINVSRTGDFENWQNGLKDVVKGNLNKQKLLPDLQSAINLGFDQNGMMDGENFQNAMSRIRAVKQSYLDGAEKSDNPLANRDMATLADQALTNMKGLVRSQVPENVADSIDAADKLWAGKQQLVDATNRASGNGGVYTPSQGLTTTKKFDTSVNNNMSARGQMPGQDFLLVGQKILGTKPVQDINPKGAFWGSTVLGLPTAVASGLGAGTPVGAATAAIGAGLYAPGVKQLVAKALFDRPKVDPLWDSINGAAWADAIRRMSNGGD